MFPEFGNSKRIQEQQALVFDADCRYDLIIGNDLLTKMGIKLDYEDQSMTWMESTIPMKGADFWTEPINMLLALNPDWDDDPEDDAHVTVLKEAKYETTSPEEVARMQEHLTPEQQDKLAAVLRKYTKLFDNNLDTYPHAKLHLELEPGSKPVHQCPYAVPKVNEDVFKKELEHLCEIGVLEYAGASEWAAPTMGISKKDGRIRIVSDFRELNKCIKHKVFPLPNIQEVLRKRPGYEFLSKLDLTMMYYTFELDEESKDLCTIITPFGKYRYRKMPMGIKCAPDTAQDIISNLFREMEEVSVFIDDIGVFDNSFDEHMSTLDKVLKILEDNNFKVNPLKCKWCIKETNYLGYWMTPEGLKPWKKKIDAILRMERPTNVTELRSFLGAVGYYHDMFPHRSHILAPLTRQTGGDKKAKIAWNDECELAFKQMKALLAEDVLLAYPDYNLPFDIYTDASDYQLGAVIMQNGRPIAFYSRKLTSAQMNYTVMEKEQLSMVETLKAYRSMLYGADIRIHTDHKNLTYTKLNSRRVLRWRLLMEDYNPTFYYIPGKRNAIADSLSHLGITPHTAPMEEKSKENEELDLHLLDCLDCFLWHPQVLEQPKVLVQSEDCFPVIDCPLQYSNIRQEQQLEERSCRTFRKCISTEPLIKWISYASKLTTPSRFVCHQCLCQLPWNGIITCLAMSVRQGSTKQLRLICSIPNCVGEWRTSCRSAKHASK